MREEPVTTLRQRIEAALRGQDVAWCDRCGTYRRIDEHIEHVADMLMTALLQPDIDAITDAIHTEAAAAFFEDVGDVSNEVDQRIKALLAMYAPRLARAAVDAWMGQHD